ncbi:hypothetical protein CKAH01_07202 [Colletotrichum kahawae]|uniref:Uncharacterized protein n=1 Tax=Colletotrichum kahawae TaxID=34407 RepID=A0AAD9Y6C4_COLKA|nr:hypothetical protein CKAH01_07202 [Colletotrichum kahawae]
MAGTGKERVNVDVGQACVRVRHSRWGKACYHGQLDFWIIRISVKEVDGHLGEGSRKAQEPLLRHLLPAARSSPAASLFQPPGILPSCPQHVNISGLSKATPAGDHGDCGGPARLVRVTLVLPCEMQSTAASAFLVP